MVRLFDIAGAIALSWLLLATSLFLPDERRRAVATVTGLAIPAALSALYAVLVIAGWGSEPEGGFGSLAAVRALFYDDRLLLAGWLHYLAFDLIIATWLVEAGRRAGVPRLLLLASLPLAFLFAPAGWLAGIILMAIRSRTWPRVA